MENTRRIQVVSRICRFICTALIFLVPVISALFWIYFNKWYPYMNTEMIKIPLPVVPAHDLSAMTRLLAFIVQLIPNGAIIYGIIKLRRLFSLYEKGMFFLKENVACFRGMGWAFIMWVGADIIVSNSLLSVVLTAQEHPHMLKAGIGSGDVKGLFVGIVVLVVSWAMDEGRKIAEEQEQFI